MILRTPLVALASIAFFAASPATACEFETWLFQLPGETEQEARERSGKVLNDYFVVRRAAREEYDLENADDIYIARVIANNRSQGAEVRPTSQVQPVEAIKGNLPTKSLTLTEVSQHSCSNWGDGYGDGEATAAEVGTLVVVFEGLPKSKERPNGIDSLRATSIRDGNLLNRLSKHGKALAEKWE